jgi:hypothetical protein
VGEIKVTGGHMYEKDEEEKEEEKEEERKYKR